MMMQFERWNGMLKPWDLAANDFVRSLPNNRPIVLEPVYERDMFEHRKIFAQIGELARAIGTSPELLRAELLMECGLFHPIGELFGKTVVAVQSMSQHSMRDTELHAFWDEAKDVIAHKMLRRIKDDAERERLVRMLSLQAT